MDAEKSAKIKAVIFDLDNTLMDFTKMKSSAIEAAAEAMVDAGLPMTKQEAIETINRLYKKFGIEYQRIFDEVLREVIGRVDPKILAAGVVAYRRIKEGYVEPYPHVVSTLLELKERGYRIGLISDAPAFQAWSRLAGMKMLNLFDFVLTFEDSGVHKPDKLPFESAMGRLGLKAGEMMMVGDNPQRDVAGAKRLGMVAVLAKYGCIVPVDESAAEQKADYEINDIQELLEILR